MEVTTKDTYRCLLHGGFSETSLVSLAELYQPLIGPEAVLVYLTLAAESRNPHTVEPHTRLLSLMHMSAEVFDRALARLEEYMLVRVYRKEYETKNAVIYWLNAPMNASDFAGMPLFMSRYTKAMGQKAAESTIARFVSDSTPVQGYTDITREVNPSSWEEPSDPVIYQTVKPKYRFTQDDENITFDYEHFFAITSPLVLPAELRTQENLGLIGRLGTVYGLTPERMKILIKDCVDLSTVELNTDKLRFIAAKSEPDVRTGSDPYGLPPVSFLQSKQNGAAVTMTDRRLLEHLSADMHFSNEVINVMVEYILKIADNRLARSFVDKIAGEWARDGVTTKEQAIAETKKPRITSSAKPVRKIEAPEYIRQQAAGTLPEGTEATKETLERAKRLQKELRDKYGNS